MAASSQYGSPSPPVARMTWEEIRSVYPDQYVMLNDVELDDKTHDVRAGTVLAHGKNRGELAARVKPAAPSVSASARAIRHTGASGSGSAPMRLGYSRVR